MLHGRLRPLAQSGMLRDSGSNFLSGSIAPLKGRPQCRHVLSLPSFVRCGSGTPVKNFFANPVGGAGRWPSYGVIAEDWPQRRQADGSRTCARSEISAVHFIRWLGGSERRAGFFLFAQFTGGAGRWPSYGVIAEDWPQPRQADGPALSLFGVYTRARERGGAIAGGGE